MKRWHVLLGLAISAVAAAYFVSLLNFQTFWSQLKQVNWWFVLWGSLAYAFTVPLKAWRWQVLLAPVAKAPLGPLASSFLIGSAATALLPMRLGELVRTYAGGRLTGLPYGCILASLLVERVLDGLTLLGILFVTIMALDPSARAGGFTVPFLKSAGYGLLALYLGVLALAVALHVWGEKVVSPLERLFGRISRNLGHLAGLGLRSFAQGLGMARSPGGWLLAILISLAVWGCTLFSYWLFLPACGLPPRLLLASMGLSAAALAAAVPAGPGFVGTVQVAMYWGLLLVGAPADPALLYGLLLFVALNALMLTWGLWEMARKGFSLAGLKKESQRAAGM